MTEKNLTHLHRSPHKQTSDPLIVKEIISRAILAHVAIVVQDQPFCIPVACAPYENELLLHGSTASRLFKVLASGAPACVSITNIQALVLAASAFDSSMHYQSLMAFGSARVIEGDKKALALNALTDHLFPERRQELRESSPKELLATSVLAFPLDEISVKVSAGIPDLSSDLAASSLWVGVLPISSQYGKANPVSGLASNAEVPAYISRWPINRI
ncbi:MAG: pyridoxamine 5'-phosphate oxidase family protein [Actinobacteria bacterium]|nr:pyridoxamine 5'-phosphate oxidase family protein [Actinomycetota bacterium]